MGEKRRKTTGVNGRFVSSRLNAECAPIAKTPIRFISPGKRCRSTNNVTVRVLSVSNPPWYIKHFPSIPRIYSPVLIKFIGYTAATAASKLAVFDEFRFEFSFAFALIKNGH